MLIDPEEHEVRALLNRFPPLPSRIVEIGCGDGRLTRRYSHAVESVIAIDPDPTEVNGFVKAGLPPNVKARALSFEQLRVEPGSVDVVLFSWAL